MLAVYGDGTPDEFFTKPKSEEGKGYLRLDKNLWSYDPNTGKWERTTEREKIGGTNSRRSDFDESRLAEEFDPKFDGESKLVCNLAKETDISLTEGIVSEPAENQDANSAIPADQR